MRRGMLKIGSNCQISDSASLTPGQGFISIGKNCVIEDYVVLRGDGGIEIGDNCRIRGSSMLLSQRHGIFLLGDNHVEDMCIIGDNVTLGRGSSVTNATNVRGSHPGLVVIGGNPAHVMRSIRSGWSAATAERIEEGITPEVYYAYHGRRRDMAMEFVGLRDRVLDVGCGEGLITAFLAPHVKHITGIDYDVAPINKARMSFCTDQQNLSFYQMNATALNFAAEYFDKALCLEVLEHLLPIQCTLTLRNIRRVLVPGGLLIGSTPIGMGKIPFAYAHIYEYTRDELSELLLFNGFDQIRINQEFFTARRAK